jgi:quercetin dioxygenase-like cupin family protein
MTPTIEEIRAKLEHSENPVARLYHKNDSFKILMIGFKQGMVLKDHSTNKSAKLLVISGNVSYKEGDKITVLSSLEEIDIPVNVIHSVTAVSDSICLLSQG